MKSTLRRVLVLMLALMLLAGATVPAAMAAEAKLVSNATNSMTMYAGMKDKLTVYDTDGNALAASKFTWKSNKPAVVSVNKSGSITAQKAGSATITATNKSNKKNKVTMKVTVRKNKVDNISAKPTPSLVTYQKGGFALKSLEIVSPKKVVAEYYVAFNFPSSWKVVKINYVNDAIGTYDKTTGELYKGIARGVCKKISGFKAKKGRFVQTVKATFTGNMVDFTNVRLDDYLVDDSSSAKFNYSYRK